MFMINKDLFLFFIDGLLPVYPNNLAKHTKKRLAALNDTD